MPKEKCRMCLATIHKFESIFSYTRGIQNSELAAMFFNIQVTPDDNLPKQICENCVLLFEYIYSSRLKFQINQNLLAKEQQLEGNKPLQNGLNKFNGLKFASNYEKNSGKQIENFIRVPEEDINKLSCPRVIISEDEEARVTEEFSKRGMKFTKRRKHKDLLLRDKKVLRLHHYYNRNTTSLRQLLDEKLREKSTHSSCLHEDHSSFSISPENMENQCTIYRWDDVSEDLLEINMELNVFMCTVCSKMFNTKWSLRIHEQAHKQITWEEDQDSRSSSPQTII